MISSLPTLLRPTAASILPQLGSLANNAVLTRGDVDTASATAAHSASLPAFSTRMVTNFVAPSASLTISRASLVHTSVTMP